MIRLPNGDTRSVDYGSYGSYYVYLSPTMFGFLQRTSLVKVSVCEAN